MNSKSSTVDVSGISGTSLARRFLRRRRTVSPAPPVDTHACCAAECERICSEFAADGAVLWTMAAGGMMVRTAAVGFGTGCTAERMPAGEDEPGRSDTHVAGVSSRTLADLYARRAGFVHRLGTLVQTTIRRRGERVAMLWLLWRRQHLPTRAAMQRLEMQAQDIGTALVRDSDRLPMTGDARGIRAVRQIASSAACSDHVEDVLATVVEVVESMVAPRAVLIAAAVDGGRRVALRGADHLDRLDRSRFEPPAPPTGDTLRAMVEERLDGLDDVATRLVDLESAGRIVGVLGVAFDRARGADGGATSQLAAIATHATIAIESAALFTAYRERTVALRTLARMAMQTDERRRLRLARALADDVAKEMLGVLGALRTGGGAAPITEELSRTADALEGVIDHVQDLARRLHPSGLDEHGLMHALHELARAFEASLETPVDVRGLVRGRLPRRLELCAYRIAQEALRNAVKHGDPKRVVVTVGHDERSLTVRIRDDGAGFDPQASPGRGIGLLAMTERAAELGGAVRVGSKPGHGTTIDAVLPLTNGAPTSD